MEMKTKRILQYALSLAASWAWGVSLIVGMQTVREKGVIPFAIWATANSLALPLFGLIAFRIKKLHEVVNYKVVQVFTTAVMVFCLWIQMNSIHDKLLETGEVTGTFALVFTIAVAIFLDFALYRDGLIRNILMDSALWIVCYVILLIMVFYGVLRHVSSIEMVAYHSDGDLKWAYGTILILFAGPIMNIQNWQMAEKLQKENVLEISHVVAGLIFAVYMVLVYVLAHFQFNHFMELIQIGAILCITLTTMDASIVGMQKIAGAKVGFIIALLSIVFWRYVIPMGVLDLWTFMGNRRREAAILCIIWAIVLEYREKKGLKRNDRV